MPFGAAGGILHLFIVPDGLSGGTTVDVSMTTVVNGSTSAESNRLTLNVCAIFTCARYELPKVLDLLGG